MKTLQFRYPGVKPFEKEQASIFFGRQEEVRSIARRMESQMLLTLHGKSGIGKSSLIKAGVLPRLEKLSKEEGRKLKIIESQFGYYQEEMSITPISLINRLIGTLKNTCKYKKSNILNELIPIKQSLWLEIKKIQFNNSNNTFVPLFFIDQLEEVFSYPEDFIIELVIQLAELFYGVPPGDIKDSIDRTLILHPELENKFRGDKILDFLRKPIEIYIITTIRSDLVDQLDRIKKYFPELVQNTYMLNALEWAGAEDAIQKPAQKKGNFLIDPFKFDTSVVEDILNYLTQNDSNNRIEAAFELQIFCQYIEQTLKQRIEVQGKHINRIKRKDLPEDLSVVIHDFYKSIICHFDKEVRNEVRVFIEEVMIIDTPGQKRRKSLDQSDALKALDNQQNLLDQLVVSRLIREIRTGTGAYNYEISHDVLIEPILTAKYDRLDKDVNSRRINLLNEVKKLTDQAYNYFKNEYYQEAKNQFETALNLLNETFDCEIEKIDVLLTIGTLIITWWYKNLSLKQRDWSILTEAESFLLQALEKAERIDNSSLHGRAHEKLGILYQIQTDKDSSDYKPRTIEHYTQALDSFRQSKDYYLSGKVLEQLANIVDDPEKKQEYLKEAETSYLLSSDFMEVLRVKKTISRIDSDKPWCYLLDLRNNQSFPITGVDALIGRATDSITTKLSFKNRRVSRRHLFFKSDYTMEDLRSLNGTTLNTIPIPYGKSYNLIDGDIIVLAEIIPLKFFVSFPTQTIIKTIPDDAWGIFITNNKYEYLISDEYAIVHSPYEETTTYKDLDLAIYPGKQNNAQALFHLNKKGTIELKMVKGSWSSLLHTKKINDYEYEDFIFTNTKNWIPYPNRSVAFIRTNKKGAILFHGPSFQIIKIKEEY
jgi:hypothetical protein